MEFQDGFYWHPWHQGGPLWYMTADEARRRSKFINSNKPEVERPERNRLFQLADVSTIPAYVKARAAYDKAGAAYVKARAALDKARAAYVKARAALDKAGAASEVIALHAAQCGCRWTPEHPNIFEDSRD
jgi:hypothetical protein